MENHLNLHNENTTLTLFRANFMAPPSLGLGPTLAPSPRARAPQFLVERGVLADGVVGFAEDAIKHT